MKEERRYFAVPDLEVHTDDDGPFVARGHAATFDEPYQVADFFERVDARAFDDQLANPDVMALWNHNRDLVLGSVGSKTLKLSTDKKGLVSEMEFPASATREREAIERGDVRKMSFGFRTIEDRWERDEDGTELRTLLKVELYDVSPVTFPANPDTDLSVAKRSRDEWREQNKPDESWRERSAARSRNLDLAEMS